MKRPWDIFCQVVDNFGDAGVCWRLARQLVAEYGLPVRLWIDDLGALAALAPGLQTDRQSQALDGVELRHWPAKGVAVEPGAVVIEAFGCALPAAFLEAMARCQPALVWINLEYLSAEAWVDEHHGLPSRHPRLPLAKHFFFPGFTERSGGLLRERGLFAARAAFQGDAVAQARFWHALGLAPPAEAQRVSVFCYPEAPLPELLRVWAEGATPTFCVLPAGPIADRAAAFMGCPALPAGSRQSRGKLCLGVFPFLPQDDYDRLLWACDFNFVRGEDSFVRAQWAARPLVWQAYPQSDETHHRKLEAFLARQAQAYPPEAAEALVALAWAWNGGNDLAAAWQAVLQQGPQLREGATRWADSLGAQPDLARQLVDFVQKTAIMRGSPRL